MRLVVGLGNPGEKYESTRHNVGFSVMDNLAKRHSLSWDRLKAGWLKGNVGQIAVDRENDFALLKPTTFMNRSGQAVLEAAKRFSLLPSSLFVVADDFALPLGSVRIRREGSSGGHNGLQSIMDCVGTAAFPRLRVGIGPSQGDPAEFVLSRFSKSELDELPAILDNASNAVDFWLAEKDIDRCMSEFNRKGSSE